MKPTSSPRMVLDQDSAAVAVLMANLINTEFSNIVPNEYVVYTLGLDPENPHIEEMILVQFNEKTHSGVLINIEGETIEFDNDCYIYGSMEEAEDALSLIELQRFLVSTKQDISKFILAADEIIKEIDTIEIVDNIDDFIELMFLHVIMCNQRENLSNIIQQTDEIINIIKKTILEH